MATEMNFREIKLAIQRQFNNLKSENLFRVNADKDAMWEMYLNSFPAGTNPLFKERTEHDCNCCKQFVRAVGDMVAIVNGKIVSIWDCSVSGNGNEPYQVVADAMADYIRTCKVDDVFLHTENHAGTDKSRAMIDGNVKTWDHFYIQLPANLVCRGADLGTRLSDYRSAKDVLLRGLTEITDDAIDTVLELINQKSLYRGDENKPAVTEFKKLKTLFKKAEDKDLFCWSKVQNTPAGIARIRNTAIGTLLQDISEGVELDRAVASFESKVAPANYKRPTAVITQSMIQSARETIEVLGLAPSLFRRYAVLEDITAVNTLFIDRVVAPRVNDVFDSMLKAVPKTPKKLDKVEEISIDDFLTKVLPQAASLEVLVENRHGSNLVSLIAPADLTAKNLFKWDNGFCWSYNGDVADSMKEKVKQAGGSVVGDLCCRCAWDYTDDLDFHMYEPDGGHIYYSNARHRSNCGGMLDVDANGIDGMRAHPVENIFYSNKSSMKEGIYELRINNYSRRSNGVGFQAEIEFGGVTHSFVYDKVLRSGDWVTVAKIKYSRSKGFEIIESLPSTKASKLVWNIPTESFHKVNIMMLSPNYWDGQGVGNKHYFFMLEGCQNDGTARGFYNEFLTSELDKHRKVLEIVGAKMRTDEAGEQLSGLGFSSTQRNSLMVKVTGAFTRMMQVNF